MKKRKSCTLSRTRSLRDTQSLPRVRSRDSNSTLSTNKNLPVNSSPRKRQIRTKSLKNSTSSLFSRREIFKSLESLFDLNKPFSFCVDELQLYCPSVEEKAEESSDASISESQFGKPEEFVEKLKPVFGELKSLRVSPTNKVDDSLSEEVQPIAEVHEKEEEKTSLSKIAETLLSDNKMADEPGDEPVDNNPQDAVEDDANVPVANVSANAVSNLAVPEPSNAAVSIQEGEVPPVTSAKSGKSGILKTPAKTPTHKGSLYAPDYPLPPGVGQGIRLECGQNRESFMSNIPITESSAMEEITAERARANCLVREIYDLKEIMDEIAKKETHSEEDTVVLKDTQTAIMQKVRELDEITGKFQRCFGLVDPSTGTFAKMFEMLPYPHTRYPMEKRKDCEKLGINKECEKFKFPQVEYPEDKLPRVIICGNAEENFPKIVVADSRPKSRGKVCIENLTGKLNESLSMQEKLAKENAQLEGGKFKLEKELLDKDNAVECLQRKICGLRAEMRIVVKENAELSRQIACLAQQQQKHLAGCPQPASTLSSKSSPTVRSPCCTPKPQRKNLELSCKCSTREQNIPPPAESPYPCPSKTKSPRKDSPRPCCKTPRLAGGASRTGNDCFFQDRSEMHRGGASGAAGGCGKTQAQNPSLRNAGGICPAELEGRLAAYGNNTKQLGDQLSCIENEVRTLQTELLNVQRERLQLEQQRKLLECSGPCATCACAPEPPPPQINHDNAAASSGCSNDSPDANACAAQQLRDLKEQYCRLQDDYKSKLCEVSRLRADSEALKREAREAKDERERMEIKLVDAQERARAIECERNELLGTREQMVEQEQALLVARQRFRDAQEELDEVRNMVRDQANQLDDYRGKYLQAQQQVEEQRRQMDLMEMDNARMNENVTLEIGRVKNQFQEKLAELAPLPDILKQTQMKLQETQQLRMLAEHNCEDISRELLGCKERIDTLQNQIGDLQREIQCLTDERSEGSGKIEELEKKNSELKNENERLKNAFCRLEEQQAVAQKRFEEKQHEITQLTAMLEQVREDSARQVARTKERCEAIKRSMQAEISDFEIQLAQCRAAAKSAQKERDEIRQKMQGQIGNLNEALQQAQGRIRSLQGHVDYLKVSYTNVFSSPAQGESNCLGQQSESPLQGQGYDSCDCNY